MSNNGKSCETCIHASWNQDDYTEDDADECVWYPSGVPVWFDDTNIEQQRDNFGELDRKKPHYNCEAYDHES